MDKNYIPGKDGWNLISSSSLTKVYKKTMILKSGSPQEEETVTWFLKQELKIPHAFQIECQIHPGDKYILYVGCVESKAFWHQLWYNVTKFLK